MIGGWHFTKAQGARLHLTSHLDLSNCPPTKKPPQMTVFQTFVGTKRQTWDSSRTAGWKTPSWRWLWIYLMKHHHMGPSIPETNRMLPLDLHWLPELWLMGKKMSPSKDLSPDKFCQLKLQSTSPTTRWSPLRHRKTCSSSVARRRTHHARKTPFGLQLPSWLGIKPASSYILPRVHHLKLSLLDMRGETGRVTLKLVRFTIPRGVYLRLLLSPIDTVAIKIFGKVPEQEAEKKLKWF